MKVNDGRFCGSMAVSARCAQRTPTHQRAVPGAHHLLGFAWLFEPAFGTPRLGGVTKPVCMSETVRVHPTALPTAPGHPSTGGLAALRIGARVGGHDLATRQFFSSTNLVAWSAATPVGVSAAQDWGEADSAAAIRKEPGVRQGR